MNIFYRLKRMGKVALYIILSLGLSLGVLNTSLAVYGTAKSGVSTFNRMFDIENTYIFKFDELETSFIDGIEFYKDISIMLEKTDKLKDEGLIYKTYKYGWNPILAMDIATQPILGSDKSVGTRLSREFIDVPGMLHYNINSTVDFEFIKKNPIEVFKGRTFEKKDFEINPLEDRIPIIVGSEYSVQIDDILDSTIYVPIINDGILETQQIPVKFQVVGVYKPNTVPGIVRDPVYKENLKTYYEDTFILVPEVKGFFPLDYSIPAYSYGIYIELADGITPDEVKTAIDDLSTTGKVKVSYSKMTEGTLAGLTSGFLDAKSTLLLGIILVILSTIGAINIMLGHIMKRRKEIGVKLAIGATFKNVFIEFFKDMFTVTTIAAVVSAILVFMINKQPVDSKIIILNIIFAAIIAFFITILPVKKLSEIDSVELMRGSK